MSQAQIERDRVAAPLDSIRSSLPRGRPRLDDSVAHLNAGLELRKQLAAPRPTEVVDFNTD